MTPYLVLSIVHIPSRKVFSLSACCKIPFYNLLPQITPDITCLSLSFSGNRLRDCLQYVYLEILLGTTSLKEWERQVLTGQVELWCLCNRILCKSYRYLWDRHDLSELHANKDLKWNLVGFFIAQLLWRECVHVNGQRHNTQVDSPFLTFSIFFLRLHN